MLIKVATDSALKKSGGQSRITQQRVFLLPRLIPPSATRRELDKWSRYRGNDTMESAVITKTLPSNSVEALRTMIDASESTFSKNGNKTILLETNELQNSHDCSRPSKAAPETCDIVHRTQRPDLDFDLPGLCQLVPCTLLLDRWAASSPVAWSRATWIGVWRPLSRRKTQ